MYKIYAYQYLYICALDILRTALYKNLVYVYICESMLYVCMFVCLYVCMSVCLYVGLYVYTSKVYPFLYEYSEYDVYM